MRIIFSESNHFVVQQYTGEKIAELVYTVEGLKKCRLTAGVDLFIEQTGTGIWRSYYAENKVLVAEIKLGLAGLISLNYITQRRHYVFRSTGIYKTRFTLFNKKEDEIMTLLPMINWQRQGHEFTVQINEEYGAECNSLLILHALHCANCYLGMLNGSIPPLIHL